MNQLRHHIFIDNSNIIGGARRAASMIEKHVPWMAVRVHFRNLCALIEGGQTIGLRVLAGSVPPGNDDLWRRAHDAGYDTDLLHKIETDDGRLAEQGVDELLHLKIANLLLDADEPEVLVLGTGDGRVSTFGTGFALQAARALKRGWRVEVWSWRDQLSGAFTALALDHPARIRVHTLDRFYKSVTFVQGDKYGPPMLPKIVNVADRIVVPLPKALNIYGSEMERT